MPHGLTLERTWSHSPEQRGWYPVGLVGLAIVASILIKTGRDASDFGEVERIRDLPIAFMWIGLSSIPVASRR